MILTAASRCDMYRAIPDWFLLQWVRFGDEEYTGIVMVNCHKGTPGSIERMKERITEKYVLFS